MLKLILSTIFCFSVMVINAQLSNLGKLNNHRDWFDVKHYDLFIDVDIENKHLKGWNNIKFKPIRNDSILQIDLQEPMKITMVKFRNKRLNFRKTKESYLINLKPIEKLNKEYSIKVFFEGKPKESNNLPWESGFIWINDKEDNPFVSHANQMDGASIWWPCKDHPSDEPDKGVTVQISIPSELVAASNGKLIGEKRLSKNKKLYKWQVKSPINNYGVNINIGNYTYINQTIKTKYGNLNSQYYVLEQNRKKAEKYFKLEVPKTIEALEYWFGPYPFYNDGFKLVQVPYLGMEHQSSITYGNQFKKGYLGNDLSETGNGLLFDFVIVHETAHEWFANSITNNDVADMWIHEAFAMYAESLYLEYHYDYETAKEYLLGLRSNIKNDIPIIGKYNQNQRGSGDMYYKGANMLHMIRSMINDTDAWRKILLKLNKTFYHKTVSSSEIEKFLIKETGLNLNSFFKQYLREANIPTLEIIKINDNEFNYRFTDSVVDLEFPLELIINGSAKKVIPTAKWIKYNNHEVIKTLELNNDFYLNLK